MKLTGFISGLKSMFRFSTSGTAAAAFESQPRQTSKYSGVNYVTPMGLIRLQADQIERLTGLVHYQEAVIFRNEQLIQALMNQLEELTST